MAKREALTEAASFCTSKGKQLAVQNIGMNSTLAGSTNELVFRCLDSNDPENGRPRFRKEPNIVIENRNN
jgi:hypothetical protein